MLTERRRPGQDLWYFWVPEDQWYDAMVYSDASPTQTQQALQHTDPGMWWPCLVVVVGAKLQTWCQEFAMRRAKQTWMADPTRCHVYVRGHQAITWQQMLANSQTPVPAAPPLSSRSSSSRNSIYSSNSLPPPWPTHSSTVAPPETAPQWPNHSSTGHTMPAEWTMLHVTSESLYGSGDFRSD